MAKDVLTVPVSTISSESTFSMTGRIIKERRRRLKSETQVGDGGVANMHQGLGVGRGKAATQCGGQGA